MRFRHEKLRSVEQFMTIRKAKVDSQSHVQIGIYFSEMVYSSKLKHVSSILWMSLVVGGSMCDAKYMHSLVRESGSKSPGSSLLRLCTADDILVGDIVLIVIRNPKFLLR